MFTLLSVQGDENIPLRILLLLMDEVFDLRSKDQWLRRRIMLFLRQILKAMFGDIVNRRIVDYVAFITSPEQVADYIKTFKWVEFVFLFDKVHFFSVWYSQLHFPGR